MSTHPVTTTSLPPGRGTVNDVALLARSIPLFPVDRTLALDELAAVRRVTAPRVGWAALFLKAYALVAREMPLLRSWIVYRPHARLATSGDSVATLAINRADSGHDRLFFARLARPEETALAALQASIDRHVTAPVEEVFRRQLELEMVPGALRRTILRWHMNSASRKRPGRIGTFSLSTLAGFRAGNHFHPTLCTTSLCYAPVEADGRCRVTIIADHRVLDGATVARALERLEQVLRGTITTELTRQSLRPAAAPAAAA
jgi:hypothetical protein